MGRRGFIGRGFMGRGSNEGLVRKKHDGRGEVTKHYS